MLDDALAQARREQREKDAALIRRKFDYSSVARVREIVADILAQED